MASSFADIAFTPHVRAFQSRMGSRDQYAALDEIRTEAAGFTQREADFVSERDGFYQATVGENGWPYVQFRGGPAGFLKMLDPKTIGYADFRGNVQYISAGNLEGDGRITLILMDYAQRRRLKIWGRARLVDARDDEALMARLEVPSYRARVERAVIIAVEAFDWNCPQHITPRFTTAEVEAATVVLHDQLARLRAEVERLRDCRPSPDELGQGPLSLVVTGVRMLTPHVRSYTLRAADGGRLPPLSAGAHIDVPVPLAAGHGPTRRYSIASDPAHRDEWELAVQSDASGSGGSASVHDRFEVGLRLNASLPGNHFPLHEDDRPAVLIAGGIGITPIRAMAFALRSSGRDFTLHYAARSRAEMAWADEMAGEFAPRVSRYFSDTGPRMDIDGLMCGAHPDAIFYVCGPARLIDQVGFTAERLGFANRVRSERFVPAHAASDASITVELRRSGRKIEVLPGQTILEAIEADGIAAPFSCRSGACGTCATKVLGGRPEHRDTALSKAEHDQAGLMCICVSRATTPDLALDL